MHDLCTMRLKKSLGQHFLVDAGDRGRIADAVRSLPPDLPVLEIGPGDGALTEFLLDRTDHVAIEVDGRWAGELVRKWPALHDRILHADALAVDWNAFFDGRPFAVVGNFPYNISSQLLFKVLAHRERVPHLVGMFQREVGHRAVSGPGSRTYGVVSVLLGARYDGRVLFDVPPTSFRPPPKVWSSVIRLDRVDRELPCSEQALRHVVKTAFAQRRKKLSNSVRGLFPDEVRKTLPVFDRRPEQLSVDAFINLVNLYDVVRAS